MSDLLKINVNDHTEKKGGLTYLSWAWAWAEVLQIDALASWEAVEYLNPDGTLSPCMWIGDTAMVKTKVTIKGVTRTCQLPVMDNRNNAVKNPDARKISDATMRCMTKAISMHGLGLYIYAGEDLPQVSDEDLTDTLEASVSMPKPKHAGVTGVMGAVKAAMPELSSEDRAYYAELAANVEDLFQAKGASVAFDRVRAEELDADQTIHLWALLGSKVRSALKAEKTVRTSMAAS